MAGRVEKEMVTTAFDLPGYRVVENLGVVRGIVVRSRSVVGNFVAGIQTIFGGNITMYTELCEKARGDAFKLMLEHAEDREANAVIGMRYDANEVMAGVTEVLAYGTAVRVSRLAGYLNSLSSVTAFAFVAGSLPSPIFRCSVFAAGSNTIDCMVACFWFTSCSRSNTSATLNLSDAL